MFASKRFIPFFTTALILSLTTVPFITTAHQSNVCPVHEHTTGTIGTCSSLWSGESWWDPMTGCWHHSRCRLGIRTTSVTCPDGVQDTCGACGVGTDDCDEHLQSHTWGCAGNSKPHTWYSCQHDSCPYGPSS